MLIGLVRESVMQCFCHTCRVPLLPAVQRRHHQTLIPAKVKTKPPPLSSSNTSLSSQTSALIRTTQPKKVHFVTTEVRCQERTRGGLCYEVILGEADVKASLKPKRAVSPQPAKPVSVQDIQEKLKAAEERRQQLESNKLANISQKMQKIEDASRKRDDQTSQFIAATRDALDQKMETHLGKREAYITDLKTKLKDHIESVEKTRLSLEAQTLEVRSAMEEKLKSASALRDENIKKVLDRLKEHEDQVKRVRSSNAIKFHQLEAVVQEKLDMAQNRRIQLEQEQIEKLRNHNTRAVEIKQSSEVKKTEFSEKIETKLNAAEQNREKEIQRKLESAKKRNERIIEVKQSVETEVETKKTEKFNIIENKLSTAEINRDKEIQRKLENIKKNERRAETVRQNKANLVANQETASSG